VVWNVAFSPDGQTLATASHDGSIILWDVASRKPLGEPLRGHKNEVMGLAYSRDGYTLATGDMDGTIMVWDVGMDVKALETRACTIVNRNFTHNEWYNYMGDEPYRATCPGLPLEEQATPTAKAKR
jgi:WD40 repeat protein